jgi:hypothetical protein
LSIEDFFVALYSIFITSKYGDKQMKRVILAALTIILLLAFSGCLQEIPISGANLLQDKISPSPSSGPSSSPSETSVTQTPQTQTTQYTLKSATITPVELNTNYFMAGGEMVTFISPQGGVNVKTFSFYLSAYELSFSQELINIFESGSTLYIKNSPVIFDRTRYPQIDFKFTALQSDSIDIFLSMELNSYYYDYFKNQKGNTGSKVYNKTSFSISKDHLVAELNDICLGQNVNETQSAGIKFNIKFEFEMNVI